MANTRTLTDADAVITLSVDTIFPVPTRIKGFSADDVTSMDPVDNAETSLGVDGRLSAGYVPAAIRQTITLQADSQSNDFFEYWAVYQKQVKQILFASGTILFKGVQRQFICNRGVLRTYSPMPGARRILQPRAYVIEWQDVIPAPSF